MRKTLLIMATSALVVGGSLVAVAWTDETAADNERGPIGHAVEEVLDELVADDTLTREQADAVLDALEERRDEVRAEMEETRALLDEFWSDGELTQEEIDRLPEWHRWSELTEALEDGVITRDEVEDLRGRLHGGHRFRR